jgi:hypothetical protein
LAAARGTTAGDGRRRRQDSREAAGDGDGVVDTLEEGRRSPEDATACTAAGMWDGGGDGFAAGAGAGGGGGGGDVDYGKFLRPGEGAAIAAFVEAGARIPRRGEVGWQAADIEKLESVGFVMSGSRHKRMNDVRIRKENQVYSAEEKRAMALYNYEEKAAREQRLMDEFRAMLAAGRGDDGAAAAAAAAPKAT